MKLWAVRRHEKKASILTAGSTGAAEERHGHRGSGWSVPGSGQHTLWDRG